MDRFTVTPQQVDDSINKVEYVIIAENTTVCAITLHSTHVCIGISQCGNMDNFNKKTGEIEAYKRAYHEAYGTEYAARKAMSYHYEVMHNAKEIVK